MNQRIYDRIRLLLETTPGLTQKGLAERMGLNPAAINRMLYGRRNIMAEEIPLIESYLGVRLNLSAPEVSSDVAYGQAGHDKQRGFSDVSSATAMQIKQQGRALTGDNGPLAMVPVYGHAAGMLEKSLNLSDSNVVDWVTRHPAQFGVGGAFAVYVFSDEMDPRYCRGELVYAHPGRPPETNRDCLVEMKDGATLLRRFVHQGKDKVRVAQLSPAAEKDIPKDNIKAIYAIVGRG